MVVNTDSQEQDLKENEGGCGGRDNAMETLRQRWRKRHHRGKPWSEAMAQTCQTREK